MRKTLNIALYIYEKKKKAKCRRKRTFRKIYICPCFIINLLSGYIPRSNCPLQNERGADRIYHPCSRIGRALVWTRHSRQILCVKINWIAAKNTLNKVQLYVTMTQSMLREIVLVLMRNLCVNK